MISIWYCSAVLLDRTRPGITLPSGVRKGTVSDWVPNVSLPAAVSQVSDHGRPMATTRCCPSFRHGALTEKSTTGLASLSPTVQASLQLPKSLLANCPVVDHRPILSV